MKGLIVPSNYEGTATVTFDTTVVENTSSYSVKVKNGVVYLNLDFTIKSEITGQRTIGSINIKPWTSLYTNVVHWTTSIGDEKGAIKISGDGDIVIYNAKSGEEYTAYIIYTS